MIESRYPLRPFGEALAFAPDVIERSDFATYRLAGVRGFGAGAFARGEIEGSDLNYRHLHRLHAGQVVYSRLKAFEGAIAVVPPPLDGCVTSPEFPTFDVRAGNELAYISALCRSRSLHSALAATSVGLGARRERVHPDAFLAIEVPLPDRDEQARVASRIFSDRRVIEGIAASRKGRTNHLASLRAALLAPDPATTHCQALATGLTTTIERTAVEAGRTYQMAGVYSFGRGLFARGPLRAEDTKYKELNRLSQGTLVMSRLKAWEGGLALVVPRFDGWYLSPEFPTFSIDPAVFDARYLRHGLSHSSFWNRLRDQSKGVGARKERVSAERLLSMEVPVPTLPEQRRIANALDRATAVEANNRTDELLAALEQSILNRAFAGLM